MGDWVKYMSHGNEDDKVTLIRLHERTGRPLGSDTIIGHLEQLSGQSLRPGKPGPKTDLN